MYTSTHIILYFTGLTVRDLTAKRGTDFTLDSTSLTVGSGAMSSIMVTGTADGTEEGVEVLELSITPDAEYTVGTPSKATVYIHDVTEGGDVVCTYAKTIKCILMILLTELSCSIHR